MSEPMTDMDWWAATRYPRADDDWTPSGRTGRHAFREDPAETPIFNALSTGGWNARRPEPAAAPPRSGRTSGSAHGRRRRPAPDPVDALGLDPLTMPIPKVPAARAVRSHNPAYDTPYVEEARRAAFGAHALRPERTQRSERRAPERREVSESGRHHHRRPSISSLL